MSLHLRGWGRISFGANPVRVDISMIISCLHNILSTSGWILKKFSWI